MVTDVNYTYHGDHFMMYTNYYFVHLKLILLVDCISLKITIDIKVYIRKL